MKLHFVCLGKTRGAEFRALLGDYLQRAGRFLPVDLTEKKSTHAGPDVLEDLRRKHPRAQIVMLDAAGARYTSEQFARWLGTQMDRGTASLVFLLGGAEGFPDETRQSADHLLSLSPLTFPHELARVVLAEQLYRALAILRDHPYPK